MEKMLCSDAIVQNTKRIGPTFADTHFSIQRKSDGNLVINDVCNKQIAIQRKDVMSGTGVIHNISYLIRAIFELRINETCLKLGFSKLPTLLFHLS
ncbi:unnamed protein product [Trichobilharzia regenti]|nr:unnamed protein product [Trichobilharzia regenti]